jgi:hypothetical protein
MQKMHSLVALWAVLIVGRMRHNGMGMMPLELIFAWSGFLLATYSVMANDAPAQVLGTLIASHPAKKWRLWLGTSVLLVIALFTSWIGHDGDISFGRLAHIPAVKIEWFYLLGPIGLLILTKLGTPVSTSFMMLAIFSSGVVLEEIITKSMVGYGLAFVVALSIWAVASYAGHWLAHGKFAMQGPANMRVWKPAQYFTTGLLWWFWLTHDLANVAVFLPRALSLTQLIIVCVVMVASLGLIFRESGGRVHKFIFRAEGEDMDIRIATIIDAVYVVLLIVFKEYNSIPMSTTWVFVGLMGGREIGRAIGRTALAPALKIAGTRFGVLVMGALASLLLVQLVLFLK